MQKRNDHKQARTHAINDKASELNLIANQLFRYCFMMNRIQLGIYNRAFLDELCKNDASASFLKTLEPLEIGLHFYEMIEYRINALSKKRLSKQGREQLKRIRECHEYLRDRHKIPGGFVADLNRNI